MNWIFVILTRSGYAAARVVWHLCGGGGDPGDDGAGEEGVGDEGVYNCVEGVVDKGVYVCVEGVGDEGVYICEEWVGDEGEQHYNYELFQVEYVRRSSRAGSAFKCPG